MTEHYNRLRTEDLHPNCMSCGCSITQIDDPNCACGCHKTYNEIKNAVIDTDDAEYLTREQLKITQAVTKGLISHEEYNRRFIGLLYGYSHGSKYVRETGYFIEPPT